MELEAEVLFAELNIKAKFLEKKIWNEENFSFLLEFLWWLWLWHF